MLFLLSGMSMLIWQPMKILQQQKALSKNVFLIDEFIASEIEKGNISNNLFTKEKRLIKLHGHCQQKSLSSVAPSVKLLSLPENYTVETIPSGCCGMAGSFGYEKEHYDLSMKIGEFAVDSSCEQQGCGPNQKITLRLDF